MINLTEDRIADFFDKACYIVEKTPQKIKRVFPNATFHAFETRKSSVLEITTTYFTLSCLLDEKKRCVASYVFINKDKELEVMERIIAYCNNTFQYSYLLKMWISGNLSIAINMENHAISLMISELTPPLSDDLRKYLIPE